MIETTTELSTIRRVTGANAARPLYEVAIGSAADPSARKCLERFRRGGLCGKIGPTGKLVWQDLREQDGQLVGRFEVPAVKIDLHGMSLAFTPVGTGGAVERIDAGRPAPKPVAESVLRENRSLCKSRRAVRERHFSAGGGASGKPVTRLVDGKTQYLAQIGAAGTPGANGRIYGRSIWAEQIAAFKPLLSQGGLTGAVDHVGPMDGGNLKNTCIIWRELSMDGDKVMGWYQIVEDHSEGRNLKANKDAGASIGWSTFGYGYGRPATEADRVKYNIPADASLEYDPEEGPHYVVMTEWQLAKVDAVDMPSFVNARDQREAVGEGTVPPPPNRTAANAADPEDDDGFEVPEAVKNYVVEDEYADFVIPEAIAKYGKKNAPTPTGQRDLRGVADEELDPADELELADQLSEDSDKELAGYLDRIIPAAVKNYKA